MTNTAVELFAALLTGVGCAAAPLVKAAIEAYKEKNVFVLM